MHLQDLKPLLIDNVMIVEINPAGQIVERLDENRKWIRGRFDNNIGIDQPSHLQGDGQPHAHVLGRRGEEIGVVNLDGTGSHGSKFKLHQNDADALRARGFKIPLDNLVEWIRTSFRGKFLLG